MKEKLIEIIGNKDERPELIAEEILSLFDDLSNEGSICDLGKSFSACRLHKCSKFGCKYCTHNNRKSESQEYYINNLLDIEKEVLKGTDITPEHIRTKKRDRVSADSRVIIWTIFSRLYPNTLTLKYLGQIYNRDHSTVLYSKKKFNKLFGVDKEFTQRVNNLNLIKVN